jgi:hypothetical protein
MERLKLFRLTQQRCASSHLIVYSHVTLRRLYAIKSQHFTIEHLDPGALGTNMHEIIRSSEREDRPNNQYFNNFYPQKLLEKRKKLQQLRYSTKLENISHENRLFI